MQAKPRKARQGVAGVVAGTYLATYAWRPSNQHTLSKTMQPPPTERSRCKTKPQHDPNWPMEEDAMPGTTAEPDDTTQTHRMGNQLAIHNMGASAAAPKAQGRDRQSNHGWGATYREQALQSSPRRRLPHKAADWHPGAHCEQRKPFPNLRPTRPSHQEGPLTEQLEPTSMHTMRTKHPTTDRKKHTHTNTHAQTRTHTDMHT